MEKKKVLKTKLGTSSLPFAMPNSKFHTITNPKTGKTFVVEELATEDIETRRNSAYKYLA